MARSSGPSTGRRFGFPGTRWEGCHIRIRFRFRFRARIRSRSRTRDRIRFRVRDPTRNRNRYRTRARGKHPSPGRAGRAIVPVRPSGNAARSTQWRCRATLAAVRSGAAVPARKEAAGVLSAWSQPFNHPSRDRADGATLDRRRRARRPRFRDAVSVPVSVSVTVALSRHGHHRVVPESSGSRRGIRCQGRDESPQRRPLTSDSPAAEGRA